MRRQIADLAFCARMVKSMGYGKRQLQSKLVCWMRYAASCKWGCHLTCFKRQCATACFDLGPSPDPSQLQRLSSWLFRPHGCTRSLIQATRWQALTRTVHYCFMAQQTHAICPPE